MKNKEKIQILENRLNIQSKLLDKIITKLEIVNDPQLKQINQSVFNGLDSKWKYAAVDGDGTLKAFICEPRLSVSRTSFILLLGNTMDIGTNYVAIDWKNSLIKRKTLELTGSELCKAMLDRGDTRIMCRVYDIDRQHDITHVIRAYYDGRFHTKANSWKYAVPINNHGEPLTSKDVGL